MPTHGAPLPLARYNRRVTKFAVCFLLVFGELALGGMFALAIPPFFKIERGFYKSTACVYLASALMTAIGLGGIVAKSLHRLCYRSILLAKILV